MKRSLKRLQSNIKRPTTLPVIKQDKVLQAVNNPKNYAQQYFKEIDKTLNFLRKYRDKKTVIKQGSKTIIKYQNKKHILL